MQIDFEVVLKENKVYMRFFVINMFEPSLFGNPLDKELIFTYLYILKLVLDISKEVNKSLEGTVV